ncbi:hypothetical protein P153DRAFT_189971 [Dothidotthia symphoricarpi CBS 119687]|uniref:Uncharacterized protein n=1 Tax=Dothidotthia symphoricarpi CBS 119687 TaxID=1392245 RepID=A0A6A6AKB8_9PLEO|nr:uncharacterized protein P153DRAFT_189971 [Dothidotthia symphoricarpi CBS 119687]KAF2132399.1 hypothetical protein P153DRAFT_189971 [Dothidotthia symphoricarpi CBS 119687]
MIHRNPSEIAFDPDQNLWCFDEDEHDGIHNAQDFEEHHFMDNIRSGVLAYRLQSACHFDLSIKIHQAAPLQCDETAIKLAPSFRIEVVFKRLVEPDLFRVCRPRFRRCSRGRYRIATNEVQICEKGRFILMSEFLRIYYPNFNTLVGLDDMQRWWSANGKSFNWTGMPTELKEHVVLFCLHHPRGTGLYQRSLQNYRSPFNPRPVADRELGVYEVVDKLGDWCYLLGCSRQVRSITLRLCFMGSSNLTYSKGLCIDILSYKALEDCFDRLGKYYQMMGPDSLPVDQKTKALSDCYSLYPKIYPQLRQYATFRQGIQKICLKMSFVSYMRFFKVTAGGFGKYWRTDHMTFEVLEQLPFLNEIVIKLPVRPHGAGGWKDNFHEGGPQLFHHESPCPRMLHRILYERIAEALASHEHVRLTRFIDNDEKQRYWEFRKNAVAKLKMTGAELEELYRDDGGGIELEDVVAPANMVAKDEHDQDLQAFEYPAEGEEQFFPPKCRCAKDCTLYRDSQE